MYDDQMKFNQINNLVANACILSILEVHDR